MDERVREICKNRYEKFVYKYHIMSVVKYALDLARILGADEEIVETAAWMHDLGRVEKENDKNHNITGSQEAGEILKSLGMNQDLSDKVCQCILSHGRSKDYLPKTIEAEIIINADGMAHIDTFLAFFSIYNNTEGFEIALEKLDKKIKNDWDNKILLPEARNIIGDKYKAVMMLVDSIKAY